MNSYGIRNLILLLPLLLLVVGLSGSIRKRRIPTARHRPLVVRWVCGLTGTVLLAGLLYGTFHSSRFADQLAHMPEQLVSHPTMELSDSDLNTQNVDAVFQYVLGIGGISDFLPLEIREIRLSLKNRENDSFEFTFLEELNPIHIQVDLHGPPSLFYQQGLPVVLNRTLTHQGPDPHRSGRASGSVNTRKPFRAIERGHTALFHHPYSLFAGTNNQWVILESIMLLHPEDNGQKVSAEAYITRIADTWNERGAPSFGFYHDRSGTQKAGFIGLMEWTGPAFLLLFVLAGLWAQCFARRGAAFTLAMNLLMILVVMLDQSHMRFHAKRGENEDLLAPQRELSMKLSETSFFFRESER